MKTAAGFTLIELLVVIAIITLLMTIGVPSYRYVTHSNRLSAEINSLLSDMQLARAEAIKEGIPVTVCSSADQVTCSNSSDWSLGWIVFTGPDEVILRAQKPLFTGDKLIDPTGTLPKVTFNRAGFLSLPGMPVDGITLTLHDDRANANHTRCLWIASQGMITTQTPAIGKDCK